MTPVLNDIVKFLTRQSSAQEMDRLEKWLSSENHQQAFKSYVKLNLLMDLNTKKFNSAKAKENLLGFIEREKSANKRKKQRRLIPWVAASIIIGAVSLSMLFKISLFYDTDAPLDQPLITNNNIKSITDKATLTLEDGQEVVLGADHNFASANIHSDGQSLIYEPASTAANSSSVRFNTLTVPRGGTFYLVLADGTKVWLNADSQLRYPVQFVPGRSRQVELLYGEAYFEVTSSQDVQGAAFEVEGGPQKISVLGTKFNVKAYADEAMIKTTLVEGRVAIHTGSHTQILRPNDQYTLNRHTLEFEMKTVKVQQDVAWVKGELILNDLNLKQIMKVLARWYDMEVVFDNPDLEQQRFKGILRKNQNIVDILENIKEMGILKSYEIEDRTVLLK